ncbi:DUF2695 domain-containing protein [Intrasporangium sp. DVR]|uniref:DUF2695 domain-containing protein n=1 Tax=Intrasporangium sp. DVR TaxID=3127867 RepID=UPI00313A5184
MSNVIHIFTGHPVDPETGVLPQPGECLTCFVHRMVGLGGCSDGLGWAEQYRLARARRAVTLTRRLTAQGARCDCDVVQEVWQPGPALWIRDLGSGTLQPPSALPPCAGVRGGSTKPCSLWVAGTSLAL